MIERIFIPTVNRYDNQITYNMLPSKYKKIVSLVVQSWEKPKYQYDCDYVVLPDTEEYHYNNYYCLPKTRRFIYELGKDIKYCIFDDDIVFARRNSKYFTGISNMEKSKRKATEEDIDDMFSLFDSWLDLDTVTVCGCSQIENRPDPSSRIYTSNCSLSSAFWINGKDFKDLLPKLDLTSVRVGEDVCFLLSLLTNGFGNRVSGEFLQYNISNFSKKMPSTVWDQQTYEQTLKDHLYLEKLFPGLFSIVYDADGKRVAGGYKNYGKSKVFWKKAYDQFKLKQNSLERFFT